MRERIENVFAERFGQPPAVMTRAPGRLEILGNHTDYNEGTVLSVAVDRAMHVAAGLAPGRLCTLIDIGTGCERTFDINDLEHPEKGDWTNYIKGLIVEMRQRGITVPAFRAILLGTVPIAAGMSSSAALEMAMTLALSRLAGVELPWLEAARIGQACENNYVGAQTGLLDQFSSLKGKAGCLVYSDFRSLQVENVPIPAGTAFVVVNSMVKHNLTNEYNERRQACEEAVRVLQRVYPGVKALRDVSPAQLAAAKKELKPVVYRRASHVVGEISRVAQGIESLASGDIVQFGQLMFASHDSSREIFANSSRELDMLVEIARELPAAYGARLSGGGFGGITVHLVQAEQATAYAEEVADRYRSQSGQTAETMICTAADGAGLL
ncbi:MAG: galactokinase [Lentisphaerae bacterium]|jgi:galactokinase|nr:galactokinase [Lentisphaerota bacterium]